ncbi:MAG: prolyl oligopeptidase family serine peptidase [Blautia sp.]|nr:prolyl oligopeptidase family serine peptidase [Blautia sp.]
MKKRKMIAFLLTFAMIVTSLTAWSTAYAEEAVDETAAEAVDETVDETAAETVDEIVDEAAEEAAGETDELSDALDAPIEDLLGEAQEGLEELQEEIAQQAQDAAQQIEDAVGEAEGVIDETLAEMEAEAQEVMDGASDLLDQFTDGLEDAQTELEAEISETADEAAAAVDEAVEAVEEAAPEMDFAAMMAAAAEAAAAQAEEDARAAEGADFQAEAAAIYVSGYEWGPGVNKVIFTLADAVDTVDAEGAIVNTNSNSRTVTAAYLSDEKGEPAEGESTYVTLELETNNSVNGSPFVYDFMVTFMNHWADTYPVIACFKAGGQTVGFNGDCIDSRICPSAEAFANRGEHTGDYVNPMTGETESITLRYAAYEPEALVNDGAKNPLIIWLHGQGEGGTDPDIVLLGNEVTALSEEPIQGYFTTEGGANGAYVLVVQAETYWMDGGDGTNGAGDNDSRYTEALMDAIQKYVDSNEDLDTNRIYLGGCSNGGYMTVNMLVSYPDYWAAAYPNCEAYAFYQFASAEGDGSAMGGENSFGASQERWMTEEKIEAIKDIPIWFAQSADDTIVIPAAFGLPTYQALLKAGAANVWFSLFETIQGVDDPTAQYMGHWVWCYLFNDCITKVQDPAAIVEAEDESYGFVPSNDGGGSISAVVDGVTYDNIFAWMNAQSK